jgi:RNA recognition motif-containing protein
MSHRENKDRRTLYCGNLHENVTEEILFELFLQVEIFFFLKKIIFFMNRVVR